MMITSTCWKDSIAGFALQTNSTREELVVIKYCITNRIPYKVFKDIDLIPAGWIPVGSVEWVLKVIGRNITPNYYPEFLKNYLHRNIWFCNTWPTQPGIFVKPANRYKRFTGFVTKGGYRKKKRGELVCSEIVNFQNEWRCYVSNGKILTAEWYAGTDEDMEFPGVGVDWPEGFCGAVDFGILSDSTTIALVESQHPFAIGWYGDSSKDKLYIEFLVTGWKYLSN